MLGGVRLRRLLEKSCFEGQIHLFKIGRKRAQKITVLVVILTGLSKFVPIKGAWWHPFLKKKKGCFEGQNRRFKIVSQLVPSYTTNLCYTTNKRLTVITKPTKLTYTIIGGIPKRISHFLIEYGFFACSFC